MCFSPRGSILSFEGGILLSISLGLAVRIFWSDLDKFPKFASGKILEGSGQHFGLGPFWDQKWVPKNILLRGNDFVVMIQGILPDPDELPLAAPCCRRPELKPDLTDAWARCTRRSMTCLGRPSAG